MSKGLWAESVSERYRWGLLFWTFKIRTAARIVFQWGAWPQAASRFGSSKHHFVGIPEKYIDRFESGVPQNSDPT